jgi:hypothetical protein
MVLLSLGSGLITALMAHAQPSREGPDFSWFADEEPFPERQNGDNAVLPSDKTKYPQ